MIARATSIVLAGLVLTGCAWSWAPLKAYDGPELAPAELAVVRSKPLNASAWVYRVSREGVTYYQAKHRKDGVEISLLPDYYQVTLEGQCPRWAPSRRTYGAALRAGHTYSVRMAGCFSLMEASLYLWLEDVETGEDVTRSKATPIPLGNRGIMGEDAPL